MYLLLFYDTACHILCCQVADAMSVCLCVPPPCHEDHVQLDLYTLHPTIANGTTFENFKLYLVSSCLDKLVKEDVLVQLEE